MLCPAVPNQAAEPSNPAPPVALAIDAATPALSNGTALSAGRQPYMNRPKPEALRELAMATLVVRQK
jgi:hypothetical protein